MEAKSSADQHQHQPTDVICPHPNCGLAFRSQRALKKHFDMHNANPRHIKCNQCAEMFADLTSYEKHHQTHTSVVEGAELLAELSQLHQQSTSGPDAPSLKRQRDPEQYEDLVAQFGISVQPESKEQLGQHIMTAAMHNSQQIYMCRQRENDLVMGLEECSVTLDRALHMIMVMSGGNLNNIPIDMQRTSLKYSANRRQIHHPAAHYNVSSSDSGEASPAYNSTSSSSSGCQQQNQHSQPSSGAAHYAQH